MGNRIAVAVGAALLMAAWAGADETSHLKAIGEGRALYLANCASCHGGDARGGSAPSLAELSQRDGTFDRKHVQNHVLGRRDGAAGKPMPTWSYVLAHSWPQGASGAALKAHKLTAYLEFVQADSSHRQVATSGPLR